MPEDPKIVALRELQRRAGNDPTKLTVVKELARRRGVSLGGEEEVDVPGIVGGPMDYLHKVGSRVKADIDEAEGERRVQEYWAKNPDTTLDAPDDSQERKVRARLQGVGGGKGTFAGDLLAHAAPTVAAMEGVAQNLTVPVKYAKMAVEGNKGRPPRSLDENIEEGVRDVAGFGFSAAFPGMTAASTLPGIRQGFETLGKGSRALAKTAVKAAVFAKEGVDYGLAQTQGGAVADKIQPPVWNWQDEKNIKGATAIMDLAAQALAAKAGITGGKKIMQAWRDRAASTPSASSTTKFKVLDRATGEVASDFKVDSPRIPLEGENAAKYTKEPTHTGSQFTAERGNKGRVNLRTGGEGPVVVRRAAPGEQPPVASKTGDAVKDMVAALRERRGKPIPPGEAPVGVVENTPEYTLRVGGEELSTARVPAPATGGPAPQYPGRAPFKDLVERPLEEANLPGDAYQSETGRVYRDPTMPDVFRKGGEPPKSARRQQLEGGGRGGAAKPQPAPAPAPQAEGPSLRSLLTSAAARLKLTRGAENVLPETNVESLSEAARRLGVDKPPITPPKPSAPAEAPSPTLPPGNAAAPATGAPEALPAPRTGTLEQRVAAAEGGEFVEGQTKVAGKGSARGRAGRPQPARDLAASAEGKKMDVLSALDDPDTAPPALREAFKKAADGDLTDTSTLLSALERTPDTHPVLAQMWDAAKKAVPDITPEEFNLIMKGKSRVNDAFYKATGVPKPAKGGGFKGRPMGPESGQLRLPDGDAIKGFFKGLRMGATFTDKSAGRKGKLEVYEGVGSYKGEKVGAEIGDRTRKVIEDTNTLSYKYEEPYHAVRDQLTHADKKWLLQDANGIKMMEGRIPAPNERLQALVDWWHKEGGRDSVLNDFEAAGGRKTSGERVDRLGDSYFPMEPSEKFYEALRKGEVEGLDPNDAAHLEGYRQPQGYTDLNKSLMFDRTKLLPDEARNPNILDTIEGHLRRGARSVAYQRNFKPRDTSGETLNPGGEFGQLLAKLDPNDAPEVLGEVKRVLNMHPESFGSRSRFARGAADVVTGVNAVRMYGGKPSTAIKQTSSVAQVYSLVGEEIAGKAAARMATDYTGIAKLARRRGAWAGLRRFGERVAMADEGGPKTWFKEGVEASLVPMSAVDAQPRLLAVAASDLFVEKLHTRLNSRWAPVRRAAKTTLESMEFGPEEIAQFKNGEITEAQMARFTQRMVEFTSGTGQKGLRASAFDNPWGRTLFQGMGFGVEASRNAYRLAGAQLFKAGNPIPAARLLGSGALVGLGIIKSIDALRGKEEHREDNLPSALKESGIAGIVGDAAYAAFFDKRNDAFDRTMDGLSQPMFMDVVKETAKLVGVGVPEFPKDRKNSEVWHQWMKKVFKNEAEWERIVQKMNGVPNPK